MLKYRFEQLVDLDRVRSLLQAHHKITGVCSAILDLEQNTLVAEGWAYLEALRKVPVLLIPYHRRIDR